MEDREVAIAWFELSYKVKPFWFSKEKKILNNLNGWVEFGTITALIGPSGAGKTTLLKCLNGKISAGIDPQSKIYVNTNEFKTCFVGQHSKEHLVMCLTAKQNLIYASKLKNSDFKNKENINHGHNVRNIMQELLIEDIADTEVERCSGGEQKRLTIAAEMTQILKPKLFCIDEPTTGLDSNAAEMVMDCLKRLTKSHKMSIITSIHQPNNEIVLILDNIYVLAKGGNCVFSGTPDMISTNLNDSNIIINENEVPIEQILKLASIESENEIITKLIEKTRITLRNEVMNIDNQLKVISSRLQSRSKVFNPWDVSYIMMRTMSQQYIKQWKALVFQFLFYVLHSYFTSKMFDENISRPSGCFNPLSLTNDTCVSDLEANTLLVQNQNYIFFNLILVQLTHICYTTLVYLTNVSIFVNEHDNNWYSTGSYFLAKNIVEIIPSFINSATFAFLIYYLSGQPYEEERIIGFMLIMILGFFCTEGIGHNVGISLVNFPNIAMLTSIAILLLFVMYCHFFILVKDLPIPFQYVSDYGYPTYMFNSALILIYGLNRCTEEEESVIYLKFGLRDDQLYQNYYTLAMYAIALRFSAFLMLYLKTKFNLNLKYFKNKDINSDQLIEMSLKDTTIKCIYLRKRRLSRILSEIQFPTNKSNNQINNEIDSSNEIQKIEDNSQKVICFAWSQLTLRIPKSLFNEEKVILRQITGYFEFRTINALMGSSGAGKTSLLKCINGLYGDYITDDSIILLNKSRKIKTCYIEQDVSAHILTGLTAGQALTYASKLKNSDPLFDHKNNVKTLMRELLISNTYDTNVETCSGGEQKRLVIAMELTSSLKPNLICIDEPTSGLDSTAAEVVIKCLKSLSENHNICVITSIHQPNTEVLMMFDKLYVLAKGGQPVYSGRPQDLYQYLFDCNIVCTKKQVPIEVLLKHSCNGINEPFVHKMYTKSEELEKTVIKSRSEDETILFPDGLKSVSKRFYIRDFLLLLMRSLTYTYRYKWKILLIEFCLYLSLALILHYFYDTDIGLPTGCVDFEDDLNNTCIKTEEKFAEEKLLEYNLKYNLFVFVVIQLFSLILTTITFTADLKIFLNEQRNGWYSTGAFYWSKSVVELIPVLIIITVYSYIIDIYERSMFLSYFVFLTIGVLQIQSIGHLVGIVLSSNQRLAVFASVGLNIFSILFSNFFFQTRNMHYALQILSYLSPIKLVMESILLLYYGFDLCSDREFSYVLYFFGIDEKDFYINLQLLVLQFVVFRTLSLIALLLKVNPLTTSKERKMNNIEVIEKLCRPSRAFIYGLTTESETVFKV